MSPNGSFSYYKNGKRLMTIERKQMEKHKIPLDNELYAIVNVNGCVGDIEITNEWM